MLIATHNLMHGLRLGELIPYYTALRDRSGLDVLCVQENELVAGQSHSQRIAGSLGDNYMVVGDARRKGPGIVFNAAELTCVKHELVPLPMLDKLSAIERLYIAGGKIKRKHALLAQFQPCGRPCFAVVSFHLDTAGGNDHRRGQVAAIADSLRAKGLTQRVVVCGDTNAFHWSRRRQPRVLQHMVSPLAEIGAVDTETGATHFFARQNEQKLTHKLVWLVGKLGLDIPLRYDVLCTNLRVRTRQQLTTLESDHDLVWVEVDA